MNKKFSFSTRSWIIAIACLWINLFIFAVFRSNGVLYKALQKEYNATHELASWPITLSSSIASISCLPSGFLSHYFTIRTIVSTGIIITSSSIAICYITNSLNLIILSIGIVQGI